MTRKKKEFRHYRAIVFILLVKSKVMNKRPFVVKVSDLLSDVWTSDTISFSWKSSTQLPDIDDQWICGELTLTSINSDAIQVRIETLSAWAQEMCDYCGIIFHYTKQTDEWTTKFINPLFHDDPTEKIHDENFHVDLKNGSIDLEDFIVQSINLATPVTYTCSWCVDRPNDGEDIPTDEESSTTWWAVVFT